MALTSEQFRVLTAAFPARGASRHDPATLVTVREAIVAAIRPVAAALDFDLDSYEPLDAAALQQLPPHLFLAWLAEDELTAYFFAIPESELSESLAHTLVMLAGSRFTDHTSLSPEQWAGALRLMAAVGSPYARDAAAFHANYVAKSPDHEALPDLAELGLVFDSLAPCFVENGAGLHKRFSRAITVVHATT
ncbi:MAG: hypothetical protein JNL82_21215 [Myxococcales bacterium]|jgi:hypothetical protein|nr:hypothetical protein [Myxococcales bacterium]